MCRPPRILLPHSVVMLTSRVQQGIPFVCTPIMEMTVWSALAVAQNLHPLKVIAFVIMGNHVHILALVEDPTVVESFMERFKCESAHAINRLLDRRQVTVWCEGYDSPTILTLEDLLEKLAYIYANPVRAHLTDSIENYQGVSSWRMYISGSLSKAVKRIRRSFLRPLPAGEISKAQHFQIAKSLEAQAVDTMRFDLTPDAWLTAFPALWTPEQLRKKLLVRLKEIERDMAQLRKRQGITLPSSDQVFKQPINTSYKPKAFGRRMWCICSDIPLRIAFISFIKKLRSQAREVRAKWLQGNMSVPFAVGLFPPSPPILANLMPRVFQSSLSFT